jgi:hypothetical protein
MEALSFQRGGSSAAEARPQRGGSFAAEARSQRGGSPAVEATPQRGGSSAAEATPQQAGSSASPNRASSAVEEDPRVSSPITALISRLTSRAVEAERAADTLSIQLSVATTRLKEAQQVNDSTTAALSTLSLGFTRQCDSTQQESSSRLATERALWDVQGHIPVLRDAFNDASARLAAAEAHAAESAAAAAAALAGQAEAQAQLARVQGQLQEQGLALAAARAEAAALREAQGMASEEVAALRERLAGAELVDVHALRGELALALYEASEARLKHSLLQDAVTSGALAAGEEGQGQGEGGQGEAPGEASAAGALEGGTLRASARYSSTPDPLATQPVPVPCMASRIAALMASPPHQWAPPPQRAPTPSFLSTAQQWSQYAEAQRGEVYRDTRRSSSSGGAVGSPSASGSAGGSDRRLQPLTTMPASPTAARLAAGSIRQEELALMREERAKWGRALAVGRQASDAAGVRAKVAFQRPGESSLAAMADSSSSSSSRGQARMGLLQPNVALPVLSSTQMRESSE